MNDLDTRVRLVRQQVARLIRRKRNELREDIWRSYGKRSELEGELRGLRLAAIWLRHAKG